MTFYTTYANHASRKVGFSTALSVYDRVLSTTGNSFFLTSGKCIEVRCYGLLKGKIVLGMNPGKIETAAYDFVPRKKGFGKIRFSDSQIANSHKFQIFKVSQKLQIIKIFHNFQIFKIFQRFQIRKFLRFCCFSKHQFSKRFLTKVLKNSKLFWISKFQIFNISKNYWI